MAAAFVSCSEALEATTSKGVKGSIITDSLTHNSCAVPLQTTMPDPFLPLARTTLDNGDGSAGFADDVMTGKAPGRIQTPEEWYRCRKPELRKRP